MKTLKLIIIIIAIGATQNSCVDNTEGSPDFDRTAMLQNMATNIIIPAYTDLSESLTQLKTAVLAFTEKPTFETLTTTQEAWQTSYLTWQYANAFNFGPGGEDGLRKGLIEEVGTFPVSEAKIENAISSGTYNFSDFNRDARGFLAVEYLLFSSTDNDQLILDLYTSGSRKKYLNDVVTNTSLRVDAVLTEWSGGYNASFVSNNGTDVGSSTSQLYNEFVKSYESIKNFKIELPLGKRPGQTQTEPDLVEAYYSGASAKMLNAHLVAVENIWYGRRKDGTDGVGFEEYLASVTGGPELIAATKAQLVSIKTAMAAIPETPRLSSQIKNTPTPIENVRIELQKNTRYFKSDMSSLLGIAITFSSGDGD